MFTIRFLFWVSRKIKEIVIQKRGQENDRKKENLARRVPSENRGYQQEFVAFSLTVMFFYCILKF